MWEAKKRVPAGEFYRWVEVFKRENDERPPILWYLAAICSGIEGLPFKFFGKEPPAELRKPATFMLTFTDDVPAEREKTEEELIAEASARSMAAWGAVLFPGGIPDTAAGPKPGKKRTLPPGVRNLGDPMPVDGVTDVPPATVPEMPAPVKPASVKMHPAAAKRARRERFKPKQGE